MKAVFFDLDGTLLDTVEDIRAAINYALRAWDGSEASPDDVRRYVGRGLRRAMASAAADAEVLLKGKVEAEGRGLPGVVVSDGRNCAVTDAKGRYELAAMDDSRFVFVSTPSGYLPQVEKGTVPVFYKEIKGEGTYDFTLGKNPVDDRKHVCLVQSDVQLISEENLEVYDVLLDDMMAYRENFKGMDVFGLDCGDIVGDTPSLFAPYTKTASQLDMPVYRAIGNHDMDYYGRTFVDGIGQLQ